LFYHFSVEKEERTIRDCDQNKTKGRKINPNKERLNLPGLLEEFRTPPAASAAHVTIN
jgi:hypothetical protein